MTGRWFIDTNVFVYAVDRVEREKRQQALEVLGLLGLGGHGAISSQVVGEFVRAASTRLATPLAAEQIELFASDVLSVFELVPIDERVVREAVRCWRRYSISYWDAQVWATACIAGIDVILTEDRPAEEIEGVRYVDPFSEGFSAGELA
jgi:predicted nucleic acid-binding protein